MTKLGHWMSEDAALAKSWVTGTDDKLTQAIIIDYLNLFKESGWINSLATDKYLRVSELAA